MCGCFGCINGGPCKAATPQQHALWKKKVLRPEKRNKYGAERVVLDGVGVPSKLEAAVMAEYKLRQKAGEIRELKHYETVELTLAKLKYKTDGSYVDCVTGVKCFIEAKGAECYPWKTYRRLWPFYGPGPLDIWRGSYKNYELEEVIVPKGVR